MLATVATQTLNTDESLRDVKTRPFSPQRSFSPQMDFKPEVKPFVAPVMSSAKAVSSRNPRRLTDYDVFGFHQVCHHSNHLTK